MAASPVDSSLTPAAPLPAPVSALSAPNATSPTRNAAALADDRVPDEPRRAPADVVVRSGAARQPGASSVGTPDVDGSPRVIGRSLTLRFGRDDEPALRDIEIAIASGERVALVGPSGAGKTSLLRVLEGSLAPSAGHVERNGRVALVYQDQRLVTEKSVLANVCAGAFGDLGLLGGVFGFPRNVRDRARELLDSLGLAAYAGHRVASLSGGQRQRVAIARALCARSTVLLADEPLASLDPVNARRVLDLLAALQAKHGFALLLSLHQTALSPGYFDRTIHLANGRICPSPTAPQPGQRRASPLLPGTPEPADSDRSRVAAGNGRSARLPHAPSPSKRLPAVPVDLMIDVTDRDLARAPQTAPPANGSELGTPTSEVELPGQDRSLMARRRWMQVATWIAGPAVLVGAIAWSWIGLELDANSFKGLSKLGETLARFIPESWAAVEALPWASLSSALVETIQMGILGTAGGIAISLPLAVLASRQTAPGFVRHPIRLLLNMLRTIPSIIWALMFLTMVSLGALSGVLALAGYSTGYLAKFFYEALEDVDDRPAGALRALGASHAQVMALAILPASRPALIGSCLFMLEYNIRAASILGVVGAGGIGAHLHEYITYRNYTATGLGLLMLLVVVLSLDAVSQWWRRRLTRQRGT